MGFIGKPSKACEPCRGRRTRCDQQKPKCGQCVRKLVPCTYRNTVDLAFRSENEIVARKVQVNQVGGDVDIQADTNLTGYTAVTLEFNVLESIGESIQEVAKVSFFSKWSRGIYNEYIPSLYRRDGCSIALTSGVEAVGLATLSLVRSDASLMIAARRSHAVSLGHTQHAIASWKTAKRADTLAAIMLLALFAGLTSEPKSACVNWSKHIKGALAVLTAKPEINTDDPINSVICHHIALCVLVDCLQRAIGPPKHFQNVEFEPCIPTDYQQRSERILNTLANLKNSPASESTIPRLLKHLDAIDEELEVFSEALILACPIPLEEDKLEAVDLPIQTYSGPQAIRCSRTWNMIRLTKLLAYELRYDKIMEVQHQESISDEEADTDLEEQLEFASSSAAGIILDICASVPKSLHSVSGSSRDDRWNWSHSLLWPLSVARASQHAPKHVQPFLKHQLGLFWDATNLSIADYHNQNAEAESNLHSWTHVLFMN